MDAISLVLESLAVGGTSDTVQEAYRHLKERLAVAFSKQSSPDARLCAEVALKEYENDHEVWKEPLRKALTDAGIDQDEDLLQTAQKILHTAAPVHKVIIIGKVSGSTVSFINKRGPGNIHIGEKGLRKSSKRPLGILKGKASFKINDDFQITDDEFLSS